jgi:hypothetical protein
MKLKLDPFHLDVSIHGGDTIVSEKSDRGGKYCRRSEVEPMFRKMQKEIENYQTAAQRSNNLLEEMYSFFKETNNEYFAVRCKGLINKMTFMKHTSTKKLHCDFETAA